MNRRLILLAVCLLAIAPQSASALEIYASWIHRYASADLIVAATIVETEAFSPTALSTYQVTDVIVGKVEIGEKLKVPQYQRHVCSHDELRYAVGEQVLLALQNPENLVECIGVSCTTGSSTSPATKSMWLNFRPTIRRSGDPRIHTSSFAAPWPI